MGQVRTEAFAEEILRGGAVSAGRCERCSALLKVAGLVSASGN